MKCFFLSVVLVMPFLFAGSLHGEAPGRKGSEEGRDTVILIHNEDHGGGWLGVTIAEKGDTAGAKVAGVAKGSPAEAAGVKKGDVILEVNGKSISDRWDLLKEVREADPGSKAELLVMRGGKRRSLTATLKEAPGEFGGMIPHVPHIRPPVPHRPFVLHFEGLEDSYGLSLMDLTDQLAGYFGVPDRRGVLVQEVDKGSQAEQAGFQAGDVIIAVGKDTVEDEGDVWSALDHYKEGEKADIRIFRKGSLQTLGLVAAADTGRAAGKETFGPRRFRYDFHWDSERFERQMKKLGERLGLMGKNLEERMKGMEKRIKEKLARIEV